jgi:hypothetical protein
MPDPEILQIFENPMRAQIYPSFGCAPASLLTPFALPSSLLEATRNNCWTAILTV